MVKESAEHAGRDWSALLRQVEKPQIRQASYFSDAYNSPNLCWRLLAKRTGERAGTCLFCWDGRVWRMTMFDGNRA
jgi:hypothetical protein